MTLRTGLILLAAAAGLALAWLAHDILLLAFLGLVIAVVLSFPVGWLCAPDPARRRRAAGAARRRRGGRGRCAALRPDRLRSVRGSPHQGAESDEQRAALAVAPLRRAGGEGRIQGGGEGERGRAPGRAWGWSPRSRRRSW